VKKSDYTDGDINFSNHSETLISFLCVSDMSLQKKTIFSELTKIEKYIFSNTASLQTYSDSHS